MNDWNVQIIKKDGCSQYIVLPIENYREIISLLDDTEDCSAIDQALIEDKAGETAPSETVNAILNGVPPLRAWRQCRGFTLESLAERVGVSKGYLSQIENSRKPGTLSILRRISIVLSVPIDDLVEWNEEEA